MDFQLTETELILSEFGEFLAGLLNRITICSDPSLSPKSVDRLFPQPSKDPKLNEDWNEFVQPELRLLFASANEIVNGDLAGIEQVKRTPEFVLRIPLKHAESWLCSLNQARLALATDFEFTDKELENHSLKTIISERDLARFQIDFYAHIQEVLIQAITNPDESA